MQGQGARRCRAPRRGLGHVANHCANNAFSDRLARQVRLPTRRRRCPKRSARVVLAQHLDRGQELSAKLDDTGINRLKCLGRDCSSREESCDWTRLVQRNDKDTDRNPEEGHVASRSLPSACVQALFLGRISRSLRQNKRSGTYSDRKKDRKKGQILFRLSVPGPNLPTAL